MLWDAIVIGAGPSGAAGAYFLASQGVKVLLLEKQPFPPDKPCAGGLDGLAYRLFPEEVQESSEMEIRKLYFIVNNKYYLHTFNYTVFRTADRSKLIRALILKAIGAGAQFYDQSPAELIDEATIKSGSRTEKGRFILDASGAGSEIAPRLGIRCLRYPAISTDLPISEPSSDRGMAVFKLYPYSFGYSWLFPKRECFSVGSGGLERVKEELQAFLEIMKLKAGQKRGWILPVRYPQSPLISKNILILGDAAGLVDPLTGAGISWGMLSGKLAAQAIIEGASKRYQELVGSQILPDFRIAAGISRFLPWLIKLKIFPHRRWAVKFIAGVVAGRFRYRDIWKIWLSLF